ASSLWSPWPAPEGLNAAAPAGVSLRTPALAGVAGGGGGGARRGVVAAWGGAAGGVSPPPTEPHQYQRSDPAQPEPPAFPDRRDRLGPVVRARPRRQLGRVVLPDQWLRVGPDGLRDAADVPPDIKVAATRRVIVTLDAGDDRFPDAGLAADL